MSSGPSKFWLDKNDAERESGKTSDFNAAVTVTKARVLLGFGSASPLVELIPRRGSMLMTVLKVLHLKFGSHFLATLTGFELRF